jgi:tetratricopeptide (TPR) repeat protein
MLRWKTLPIHKGVGYIRMLANQSVVRLLQGEYDLAELSMLQALRYIENRKRWRQSGLAALIYNNMAVLKMRNGELEEGEEYANKALSIYTRGKSPKLACLPYINIGWARLKQDKPQEAEECLRKALKDLEGRLPLYVMQSSITFAHSNTLILLADALYRQEKVTEADQLCDGIIKSLTADNSSIAITSVLVLTDLANTLIARKDFVRAEPLLEQTYALVRQFPTHPDCQPLLQSYAELLCLTHRESELPDLKNWVRPVLIEASP